MANKKAQKAHSREDYLEHLKEPFLEALSRNMFVTQAAQSAGISRRTVYTWREKDAEFAKKMDSVDLDNTDKLKSEAVRRAVLGYEVPIYFDGKQVGSRKEYSDRLLEMLLKARDSSFKDFQRPAQINIQFMASFVGDVGDLLNRNVPDKCPHCAHELSFRGALIKELEYLTQNTQPAV